MSSFANVAWAGPVIGDVGQTIKDRPLQESIVHSRLIIALSLAALAVVAIWIGRSSRNSGQVENGDVRSNGDQENDQGSKDDMVLAALAKHGDKNEIGRNVDHWAYFPNRDSAQRFKIWCNENGYVVDDLFETNDSRFCVRFKHHGTMVRADITARTTLLAQKALDLGGEYDGWETQVTLDAAQQGDAPEPATNANPASRSPSAPAR